VGHNPLPLELKQMRVRMSQLLDQPRTVFWFLPSLTLFLAAVFALTCAELP
jgi:uncharacterized membrane protein